MNKLFVWAMYCFVCSTSVSAQNSTNENTILWQVTGKGLQKPSYLFGTYHFLTNSFIDTLPEVMNAYKKSGVVAGELVIDSSLQRLIMQAAVLEGTTLKKVLPDTLFAKAAAWFTKEAGLDIANFDQLSPITVMTVAMAITQQKYFPNKPGETQLDTYFQQQGTKDGKKIIGLETIDIQINALFKHLTLARQVEILDELFKEKDGLKTMISFMNDAYVRNDMKALQQMMYDGTYRPDEIKVLLDDRNNNWMLQLPALMTDQPVFVAVGALHLAGKTGLVNQLREKGYTVTPVNSKAK